MKRDFIAEAIADFEGMSKEEKGQMVLQILEDQPVLMGFITNLADDFSDSQHEALVDSVAILINAFIAKGLVVEMIPRQIVDEIIEEKVEAYEQRSAAVEHAEMTDSPLVFKDLENYALFRSNLSEEDESSRGNFSVVLNVIIAIIERSIAVELEKKSGNA